MSKWAAREGALAPRRAGRSPFSGGLLMIVCALTVLRCNCTPDLKPAPQKISIAQGQPSITPPAGAVQHREPPKPADYTETNPFQIDSFSQKAVAKVDVLWVIDNSASMGPKQAKVARDFQQFINKLTTPTVEQETIDYHIGVVTTDTYDAAQSGILQNPAALHCSSNGQPCPWIGPETCADTACAVQKFQLMAKVGTSGSGDEKGLLAAEMALTEPLVSTAPPNGNAGFLRQDASLAVIIVSDEEDSSCLPVASNQEGCSESAIAQSTLGFGSMGYYARFFEKVKGFGNEPLVSMSVFVGTRQDQNIPSSASSGIPSGLKGCFVEGGVPTDPLAYAVYAPRYMTVSTDVSGPASVHSICDENFSSAADDIYKYATLQSTFFLTREPADHSMVQACVDGTCSTCFDESSGTPPAGTVCLYDPARNAVSFVVVPAAGSTIKISYKVHANAG